MPAHDGRFCSLDCALYANRTTAGYGRDPSEWRARQEATLAYFAQSRAGAGGVQKRGGGGGVE